MIILSYLLIAATGLILVAAAVMATRDRIWALGLVAGAFTCGIVATVVVSLALGREISPRAYRAVADAASRDDPTDAAAQWAIADNVITPGEYGDIDQIYHEDTGRHLMSSGR